MRQIILDTETTGLQTEEGHRIIEIGCVELVNRKFTGERFHRYINPQREIDQGAIAVHGITNHFLADKPRFVEVAQEFLDFISGAELIIHNAPFDTKFIDYEFSLANKKFKLLSHYCRITDSLVMARQLHIGQRNSLDALCKRYFIDNSHREYHGALLDAHLLAQVYLAMTGGQGNLFDELQAVDNVEQQTEEKISIVPATYRLQVLKADEAELCAHEEYLQGILKGKCVWLE
jgi:DNA polymerase-3 subunit epsilon